MAAKDHLLLLLLSVISLQVAFAVTNSQDVSALQSLMSVWQNLPSNWKTSTDPCGVPWDGITCVNGRVTQLKLPGLGIRGKLNSDISLLSELTYLDLSSNPGLGGSLPSSIGLLQKLTTLILQGCSFSGSIPDQIGNMRNLTFLALNSNNFTGNIPATIGFLSNLYWLDLADNQLTGPLPISNGQTPGLDSLTNTKHFHFNKNQLSGILNATLFSSKMTLIHMIFDSNNFTGAIPETIGLVKTLEILQLDNNKLNGNIPTSITNLTNLFVLNLANNQLTGKVPDLSPLTQLNSLDLSNNTFTSSTAPAWFSTLTSLTSLAMENGRLTGEVPPALFTFSQIQQVLLDSNKFNGTLDMGSNLGTNLQTVSIRDNDITDANITSSYNGSISLYKNPLCQVTKYSNALYCQSTQNILPPYTTSRAKCGSVKCPDTQMLSPRNCTCAYPFSGLMVFRAPRFNDISDVANFQDLESSLWNQLSLAPNSVYISDVAITGNKYIEANVALFPLSGISFSNPDIIRLGFDLSNQTFSAPAIFGPYYFLQYPYQLPGSGNGGSSLSTGAIAGIAVGGCVILIALALVAVYALKQRRRAQKAVVLANPFASWGSGGNDDGTAPQLKGAKFFSFEELKKCTGNFSENNEIGAGGYGKVYKGYLTNGLVVAIKRAEQGSMQGAQEFKNEIELLSRVHHKNLVSLVGFCYEQGEQMLVYEYISNGTLRDNLVGKGGPLDWKKRLQIALGSARGLAYLHELADPPIIHRDIKSTNILLDENLNAKVADFGLSKLISDTQKGHVSTQVKGTLGYLDPEYYMTQQLSEKSDVYSFGVVMLELVTARLPIERNTYIVREVKKDIDQYDKEYYGLRDIMDPKIINQAKNVVFRKFVQLALECVSDSAADRPSMNEVVKEIELILQNVDDDSIRSMTVNYSDDSGTGTNPSKHAYSEQYPIMGESSSGFDSSGAFPYQTHVEPK